MLLRTRITAMVAAGLVLAALGWSAAALLREQLLDQRLTAAVQTAQSALWSQVLAPHDSALDARMDKLLQLPGFERAVRRRDAAALAALLERAGPAPGPGAAVDVVALLGMGRDPVVLGASPYRELLDAAGPRLKVVANVAVGYDNIDVAACSERGVVATNTPGVLTEATADIAFALILRATRRLGEGERRIRSGDAWKWGRSVRLGTGLQGKTLGVVGMGGIGRATARRALRDW